MVNFQIIQALPSQTIEPREFLRYCFNIDQLSLEDILEEEVSFGYCTQCVRLLSKILGMKRKTIREWGNNPNFERMPQYARMTCTYVQIALSRQELNRIISQDYEPPKVSAMKFIEEILLKDLSPSERLKITSSAKFRTQCFTLLTQTLKASKRTIYEWGSNLELSTMPAHYQHTLAYALMAYKKQQKNVAKKNVA